MKYLIVPLALAAALQVNAEQEEWVSVGVRPTATTASTPAQPSLPAETAASAPVLTPAPGSSGDGTLLSELLMQVEQMQQEIATLRSTVESQSYEIRRLTQEGEARYLDLDRRLVDLSSRPVAPAEADTPEQTPAAAYKSAMALVREKQFEQASAAFEQFIEQWPEDELSANALYWSGEVFLVRRDLEQAAARFRQVIDEHPEHIKAADATYKYAMSLHKQGDADAARHWLETLIERYTGKADSTVKLAQAYLKKLPVVGGNEKN